MRPPPTCSMSRFRTWMHSSASRCEPNLRSSTSNLQGTFIYVTHDQAEALTMSDRIAVMNLGKLLQFDSPHEIYNNPRTKFVASFMGSPP